MKYKKPILISALLFMFFSGCKKAEENNMVITDKFPEEQSIKGIPIEKIELISGGNVNLVVVDSFLVVQKKEDPLFQIYSITSHDLLAELGYKGRGPDEFGFPELLNQISRDKISNYPVVNIYDYDRQRFSKLNIINAINQSGEIFNHKPIPDIDKYLTYFSYMDDDLLVATPEQGGRFLVYDKNKSEPQFIPFLPVPDIKIGEDALQYVYRSASFINKELGLMAAAPIHLGQLDFFDLEGSYLRSTVFESANENTLENQEGWRNNIKYLIVDLDAKGELIYGLNYNNKASHLYPTTEILNLKIQVFDWQGKAVSEYILDDNRFISSFAVDVKNSRFYGYCPDELEHPIIMYDLEDGSFP